MVPHGTTVIFSENGTDHHPIYIGIEHQEFPQQKACHEFSSIAAFVFFQLS